VTSAAERACALVGNMLAAGPRNASEILAASEGDNISERTIQRAAIALGAVKTKAGFNGGWTWCLPADDGGSRAMLDELEKDGSLLSHPREDSKGPATVEPSRAKVIAARLRRLEEIRGKKGPFYAEDSRVMRWAELGIRDPDLREAYERAVTALEDARSLAFVSAGFLDPFVMQVISEGDKA
jgi:hypothetical protein